jgi:hypothetical protein
MPTFTLYYGAEKPLIVRGANCVRLARFAQKYPGWHSFASDRATRRAVSSLARLGCAEVSGEQFRFKYPKPDQG